MNATLAVALEGTNDRLRDVEAEKAQLQAEKSELEDENAELRRQLDDDPQLSLDDRR